METSKRECPNFWENCEDCLHALDIACPKIIEERTELQKIADEVEQDVTQKAIEDTKRISGKTPLVNADPETFWRWWGKTSPPDALRQKEALPLDGAVKKGGWSKSGNRKKKPKKKVAEYLKTWGT